MPKETFYHLSPEKREKVEKALENELGRTSFEKASISKIIKEAKISRGSFYQYFENKEDAITYITQKYILMEKEIIVKILKKTKGNIFVASLQIFDYMTSEIQGSIKIHLYKNIMEELKKNNINLFSYRDQDENSKEIQELIDQSILNLKEQEDLKCIMKIISIVTRTATINVNRGNMSIEEARNELKKQIEILKRGMTNEKEYDIV